MTPALDIARLRAETPGCAHVVHFNNAGAALMPQPVLDAVVGHLHLEARIGGYEAAHQAADQLERAYHSAAKLFNCSPTEVAFVENATRAWDMAFYALPFQAGDRILTTHASYASNYIAFLQRARQTGVKIDVVPNDSHGQVSVEALEAMLDARVRLVALTHVPTSGGLVNPAAAVGRLTRAAGVPFLLDACQSVGQMPTDVQALGCDMLSTTGRKYLRGPRGTGMLYVRDALLSDLEPPFLDLHAATWTGLHTYEVRPDARRFENWETNVAGKIGLATAIDYALALGLDAIRDRTFGLAEDLRTALRALPGVAVHDQGRVRCGIVTFSVEGHAAQEVMHHLGQHQVNVKVAPLTYARLDLESRGLPSLVRASVHYYNTHDEIERCIHALKSLG